MKTADPAAYDRVRPLTSTVALADGFRALMFTHSAAVAFSAVISQITNGTPLTTTTVVNIPTGGGTFLLPISGDAVTVTFSGGTCYAFM